MSLNTELISAVREGQQATDRAAVELDRVRRMYQMTAEGVQEQANKLFSSARAVADAAREKGLAAIEAAAAALDAQEQKEGQRRAADTDYLARLESKLRIAQSMGEIEKDDRARLADFFAEFANDPISVAVIEKILGPSKAFFFLPENAAGQRQQHLKGAVKTLFERAMNEAGCDPACFTANGDARAAEINAFISYCQRQSADFSRPDKEVWQEIYSQTKKDGTTPAVKFDMVMSMGKL